MLWLTLGGLAALIAGGVMIKFTKVTGIGIILAIAGAILASTMGVLTIKEQARNGAKCASALGHYGGDTCYVEGVEKDLKEIGL